MDRSDIISLLRRAASAGPDPALDEELRTVFAPLKDDVGGELITSLDVATFCAVTLRLAAVLPGSRLSMLLPALDTVANLAQHEGRHAESLLAFETKLVVNPADFNVRYAIASYLDQDGRHEEAYEILKIDVALIPYPPAWMLFAKLALYVGDGEGAMPHIDRLFAAGPTDPELRHMKKQAANMWGSQQLGVPGLDEKSIVRAVNAVVEFAWPPTLGEALQGVAGRVEAGPAARAMSRLYQWVTGAGTGEAGREDDVRILMNSGAESFVVEALSRLPATPDGRAPEWIERALRHATTARDFDSLVSGLCVSEKERGVVWHLRRLTALRQESANFIDILTPRRMAALADVFQRCQACHPHVKAEARQLLVAATAARADLVETLKLSLRALGHSDERLLAARAPELDAPDPALIPDGDPAIQQANRMVYFITWHEDPSSLIRLMTALHDDLNFYIISVGGRRTRAEVDELLFLAQAPNVFLFKGSPASWGGRKILLENAFVGIDFFLAVKPQCRWMQMLCNLSFPLLSQPDSRRRLAGNNWSQELLGVAPPTAMAGFYSGNSREYSRIHDPVHSVLRRADSRDLSFPDFLHYNPVSITVNFSDRPQPMNRDFKVKGLNYSVKPYTVDMRTMGLARFVEISDVADETGTYSSLLAPRHAQAVHSILRRYRVRTGDPFLLMSYGQAEFLVNDPVAHELYVAMAHQFGPDMNYFDTVRENSPFRGEPSHLYFRPVRNDQTVEDVDVDRAIDTGMFYTRKVKPPYGGSFARYFGERIVAELPETTRRWSITIGPPPAPAPLSRSVRALIDWPTSRPWLLRDFNGKAYAYIVATEDGRVLREDGGDLGTWSWDDEGALILNVAGHEPIRFHRLTCADGKFILAPDGLAWIETNWGRFLEQPIPADWATGSSSDSIRLTLDAARLRDPQAVLREGKSALGVAIAGFSNLPGDPMDSCVRTRAGECEHIGQAEDGTILARLRVEDEVLALRLCRAIISGQRQVLVFARATAAEHEPALPPADGINLVLDQAALAAQPWWIRSRRYPNWRELRIAPTGEVTVEGCSTAGLAKLRNGRLMLADAGDWAFCELTQISWTDDGWHLVGYGQYDIAEDDHLHMVTSRSGGRPE